MIAPSSSRYAAKVESDGRPSSAGPFWSDALLRPEWTETTHAVVVDLVILRGDMGGIGDLSCIATRVDPHQADRVGASADVPPFGALGESPDPVLLLAIGIDRVLDEFEC